MDGHSRAYRYGSMDGGGGMRVGVSGSTRIQPPSCGTVMYVSACSEFCLPGP